MSTLTAEQEIQVKAFCDKWIADQLQTNPMSAADVATAESGFRACYALSKLRPDVPIVWVKSPLAASVVVPLVDNLLWALGDSGGKLPTDKTRDLLLAVLAIVEPVLARGGTLRAARDAVAKVYGDEQTGQLWWCGSRGGYWSSWTARVVAAREILGVTGIPSSFDETYLAESRCPQWWPTEEFIVATDRPLDLNRDEAGRLHSLSRAAISWRDGTGLFFVHGVSVPEYVVLRPQEITVAKIDAETNAEVRRVMLERYGMARFVKDSGAEVVDTDVDQLGFPRRLLRRAMPGDDPVVVVEVTNSSTEPDGSRRVYHLGVHHELRPLLDGDTFGEPQKMTCHNAVASTFGLRGEQYSPDMES